MTQRSIHQLVHTLTFGDAISGEVFALQRCLRESGSESEIFAINVDPRYKHQARDYRELSSDFRGEAILHYSLGSPLNDLFAALRSARRTMIYHNLTPAKWFRRVNPRVTADIEQGLRELPKLCALTDNLIADSKFNASELAALGFTARVLELPIDPQKWGVEANPGILRILRQDPALHLLSVGRLAPNKCVEDVIKICFFLQVHLKRSSRLWIVGHDVDTELYSFSLKRLVRELDLVDQVRFVGRMADTEVRAFYQGCRAYVCMSEHEGFCCPVIEAMHFGLPVVAYASSALPETVSDGGILVREKRHLELAELIKEIDLDSALRQRLVASGRARAARLSYQNFSSQVARLIVAAQSSAQAAAQTG